ncbi:MAG: lysophospholipase L1-like esterase [Roseivirga sp.]|jgi:lysophospholipase L1-like esterase
MKTGSVKKEISDWLKSDMVINITLTVFGFAVAFLIAEIALRTLSPHNQFSSLYLGVNEQSNFPGHALYPGLEEQFTYTSNPLGYRSKQLFEKDNYGILALGGSTTECIYLGDENGWTQLLEGKLNAKSDEAFTVGNVGSAGLGASNHYLQLKHLVPQYKYIDMVLVLVGVNDFLKTLQLNGARDETTLEENYRRTFKDYPRTVNKKWYRKTELWMHMRDVNNGWKNLFDHLTPDSLISISNSRMQMRRKTVKVDVLPDLVLSLDVYEESIRNLVSLSHQYKTRIVLITQPVLWHENMSDYEEQLTIFGIPPAINGRTYSNRALAEGMELYNDRLRLVAEDLNVPIIDLAKTLPKDTTVLYDYCHFNLEGAERVADIIYTQLNFLNSEPATHHD